MLVNENRKAGLNMFDFSLVDLVTGVLTWGLYCCYLILGFECLKWFRKENKK